MSRQILLRAADRQPEAWKNNGGVTREIAIGGLSPGGAFDWRVSMADVTVPGPFSTFDGIDRTICVLQGMLDLKVAGRAGLTLDPDAEPFTFAGDVAAHGAPQGGAVLDLNVMVRRSNWRSEVDRTNGTGRVAAAAVVIILATDGTTVNGIGLDRHDALLVERPSLPIAFESAARVFTIRLLRDGS